MLNDTEFRYTISAFFWGFIVGLLFPLVVISLLTGCASPAPVQKCTFICPTNNIPTDCYCLEEEINREANKLSNGFHP